MDEQPEEQGRTCPNCGTPVTESDTFCPVCGTDLRGQIGEARVYSSNQETVPSLPAAEPPPEAPSFEPIGASETSPAGEPAPPPDPPTRSMPNWISPTPPGNQEREYTDAPPPPAAPTQGNNNRIWWIIGIIVVLFFVACCCLAVLLVAVASSDSALHEELETATNGLAMIVGSTLR